MNNRITSTIRIPTPLRSYTGRQTTIDLVGATVGEAMDDLTIQHPSLRAHLLQENGELRSFVNVFLNGQDVRSLGGRLTPLQSGDKLTIVPAIAGGSS